MMTFFLILGLALVIGLWYTLLRSTPPGGEIDQPEYEQRKRALSAR